MRLEVGLDEQKLAADVAAALRPLLTELVKNIKAAIANKNREVRDGVTTRNNLGTQ